MAKILKEQLVTSIDIGTTKICVLVGHQVGNRIEIIGVGKSPSEGLQRGIVVNIGKTIQSIKLAVREAELAAGITIDRAYIGISGAHIRSHNSHGAVAIKKGQVRESDVIEALEAARAIPVPEGYQILHVLPKWFVIDGQERVQDPIGMHGIRLEVQAHIILGAIASVQNLVTCCHEVGIAVQDIVLEQLASAYAVLSPDERQLGVALLDIGGGTSDLIIYKNSSIFHSMVLPIAGNHFTHDIAIGLRTSIADAERIKIAYGNINVQQPDQEISVELPHKQEHTTISSRLLSTILFARAQELMSLVAREFNDKKLHPLCTAGLVITGGGSQLRELDKLASTMLNMPVRIGKPHAIHALPGTLENPMYATGYGLLLYALHKKKDFFGVAHNSQIVKRVIERMKSWVHDFF
jgi:cell division protein FtsA